jgi:hypothetical protein
MQDGSLLSWWENRSSQRGIELPDSEQTPQRIIFPEQTPISCFGATRKECFLICDDGHLYLCSTGAEDKKVPTLFPDWKWELPRSYLWKDWNSVFRWLFLGRLDECSPFNTFHVEITFHFVSIIEKL